MKINKENELRKTRLSTVYVFLKQKVYLYPKHILCHL